MVHQCKEDVKDTWDTSAKKMLKTHVSQGQKDREKLIARNTTDIKLYGKISVTEKTQKIEIKY